MPDAFALPADLADRIQSRLTFLYGPERAPAVMDALVQRLAAFTPPPAPAGERLSERDVILITYGDIVRRAGEAPLRTLHDTLTRTLKGAINAVHLLPFFPYSSDDGFSVIDYTAVDPELGDWDDIARLRGDFRLMFDAVINHISVQSAWFQGFLSGEEPYTDYFITVPPDTDLTMVTRPRALPLLTPFATAGGEKLAWTTFSADQADLNYATPAVLLDIIAVLLRYVAQGASLIRLDAIAYLWKEVGTTCIHLPKTHAVVKLFRDVLDAVAPWVMLITETNVPHAENVSYFGDGTDEAQLVYNFSLPPLTFHAIASGSARVLSAWARTLQTPSDETAFFNFTASHDGIGVRPAQGLLSADEIDALLARTQAHGGYVSYKTDSDGSKSPYELNISYFDALSDPRGDEPLDLQARRFLVSQAIALALQGVPGIYFHSLYGSRNDYVGVKESGRYRSINREKLNADALMAALNRPDSLRSHVFFAFRELIRLRVAERAFHPNAAQRVLDAGDAVFALLRTAPDGASWIIALHNVSNAPAKVTLDLEALGLGTARGPLYDLVSGVTHALDGARLTLTLSRYAVCWLKPAGRDAM